MLKRLDFYLIKQLSLPIATVLIFLLTIDFIVQFSADLDDNKPLNLLLLSLFWALPEKILLFFPAALLVGSIMGLGQLSQNNELSVILAGGISKLRIFFSPAIFLIFLAILLTITLEISASFLQQKQNNLQILLGKDIKNEVWFREENKIINIKEFSPDGKLKNIFFYEIYPQQIIIKQAQEALFQQDNWLLFNIEERKINPEKYQINRIEKSIWNNKNTPEDFYNLQQKSTFPSLSQLQKQISFLKQNNLQHQDLSLQFWQRLFLPLTALVMLFLAFPFVFSAPRTPQGSRLIGGIVLGIIYYLMQNILSNIGMIFAWYPVLSALTPNLIFIFLVIIYLKYKDKN